MATPTDLTNVTADGYYGQRGVGSFETNEVEPSYRRKVFELYPEGGIQLVGLSSLKKPVKETNSTFYWYEDKHASRHGATVVYTTPGLGTQYAVGTSTTAQTLVYCKVAAALAGHFRPRHLVKLSEKLSVVTEAIGEVMDVVINGASSYLTVKVFAATTAPFLNSVNYLSIAGNVNPDGSYVPQAMGTQKVRREQHCHTFRNPVKITRRGKKQKLRTGETMADLNRKCLYYHNEEIEYAALWSEMDDGTVFVDNEPQTMMEGIIPCLRRLNSAGVVDFRQSSASAYTGKTWAEAGEQFIDDNWRALFHYGPRVRTCLCGSGFLSGIDKTAKLLGQITVQPGFTSMGAQVKTWIFPNGVVHFKEHPLFTDDPTYTYAGLFLVPENIVPVVIDDTQYHVLTEEDKKQKAGLEGYDGAVAEYITDISFEWHGIECVSLWGGVGMDNENAP